jgi:hypothetical protein
MLQVWLLPDATLPCMAAWSWWPAGIADAAGAMCTDCGWWPMPQSSMEAAANPCMGMAVNSSQANSMRRRDIVVQF